MEIEVNKIKEIYKGHYQIILDFPTAKDLYNIIDISYKYVWGFDHSEILSSWSDYDFSLFGDKNIEKGTIQARNIRMEFLIETISFVKLIPSINRTVNLIQTNMIPPPYLDLKRFNGKSRYDLLKQKIDYLFEIEIPGATDYAPIVSPNLDFLNGILEKFK